MSEPWTPSGFAEQILGIKLYQWQEDVLMACMPLHSKVTLRAANESGKTSIIAATLVLWHMNMFPNSIAVCTSGGWRQVVEQLWPNIKRWGTVFGWTDLTQKSARAPNGARSIGFSTSEEGKFEGFHAGDHATCPLLIIADEAKTIEPSIFNGIERCRPTRLLVMSSPGPPTGGFYETCQDPRFEHFHITAFDCPHLGQKKADEIANAKGRESMLYKSMIMGEWMADPNQLFCITRRAIDRCLSSRAPRMVGGLIAAIDVAHAEGGDENVLAIKSGNSIEIADKFFGMGDANAIVDRLVRDLEERRIRPEQVWMDGDGMGSIYADIFRLKGWNLNLWRGQARADDYSFFENRSAEAWMWMARCIENCSIILPSDDILFKQLCSKEYEVKKGKIRLVPKTQSAHDDRADAVVMVNAVRSMHSVQVMGSLSDSEMLGHIGPSLEQRLNYGVIRGSYSDYEGILPDGWNVGS